MKLGAATRVRTRIDGSVLEPFHPAVQQALASGQIGVESAARIVKALDEAARTASDEIACAEAMRIIRGKPHLLAPPWIDPDQRWVPLGRSRISRLNGLHKAG